MSENISSHDRLLLNLYGRITPGRLVALLIVAPWVGWSGKAAFSLGFIEECLDHLFIRQPRR